MFGFFPEQGKGEGDVLTFDTLVCLSGQHEGLSNHNHVRLLFFSLLLTCSITLGSQFLEFLLKQCVGHLQEALYHRRGTHVKKPFSVQLLGFTLPIRRRQVVALAMVLK